jgi:hypothetical protein
VLVSVSCAGIVAEMDGGKHGERHRFANYVCENSQKNGGKYESSHRCGANAARTSDVSAAVQIVQLHSENEGSCCHFAK